MAKMDASGLGLENGKYVGVVTISQMNLAGGDLPKGWERKLDVVIDFTGADPVEVAIAACGGQSLRVMLQGKLRKEKTAVLEGYVRDGYKVTVGAILAREDVTKDPVKAAEKAVAAMSPEQMAELVAMLKAKGAAV